MILSYWAIVKLARFVIAWMFHLELYIHEWMSYNCVCVCNCVCKSWLLTWICAVVGWMFWNCRIFWLLKRVIDEHLRHIISITYTIAFWAVKQSELKISARIVNHRNPNVTPSHMLSDWTLFIPNKSKTSEVDSLTLHFKDKGLKHSLDFF